MKIRSGGQWREIIAGKVFKSGAWRNLTIGKAYINGAWRDIANFVQPFSVIVASSVGLEAINMQARSASATMTTEAGYGTVSGGLGPFTYSWSVVSSSNLSGIVINSPNSASTTVTATVTDTAPAQGNAVLRCTATDSLGSTDFDDVDADFGFIAT